MVFVFYFCFVFFVCFFFGGGGTPPLPLASYHVHFSIFSYFIHRYTIVTCAWSKLNQLLSLSNYLYLPSFRFCTILATTCTNTTSGNGKNVIVHMFQIFHLITNLQWTKQSDIDKFSHPLLSHVHMAAQYYCLHLNTMHLVHS